VSERADHPDSLRPAFAGAAATFSGIGLGRFAYVPLFPAMVSAGWVTGAEGALIGASNLAGYLVGVLGGPSVARRIGTAAALDCGMLLGMVGFGACAFDLGAAWFLLWRFVSGVGGGLLMALAGPAVQGTVRAARRGVAGGIVVSGIGFGIVVASAAIPALVPLGLSVAWAALAAIVGLLWLLARPSWPRTPIPPTPAGIPARSLVLQTAYGISGGGLVPHMVYFADLAVRGYGFAPSRSARSPRSGSGSPFRWLPSRRRCPVTPSFCSSQVLPAGSARSAWRPSPSLGPASSPDPPPARSGSRRRPRSALHRQWQDWRSPRCLPKPAPTRRYS
jgi:MFS family permease